MRLLRFRGHLEGSLKFRGPFGGGHSEGFLQIWGVIQILQKIFAICKASEDFVPFTVNLLFMYLM